MSDIKIIKVATGGAKIDSSGFFIKPKQSEPSQLSQFIQKENEKEKKIDYEDDEDDDSVDSMTVSDVSSATKSDEEYTNESMTSAPLPEPSSPPASRFNSIVKDETLNSYLEKPKVEQPSPESLNTNLPISIPEPVAPVQTNNTPAPAIVNAQSTTAQPANNRNDYYSDADEDVIDMTDNKLYDILASVLEDEDGENVSENMSKMNRNLEKIITMFEAYQQNNTKDEYLSKIGEAIENQNKILTQIVKALENQGQPNQDAKVAFLNESKENNLNNELNENNNKKTKKNEKPKSSSESSSESDKGENTDDTEKNPDIKKIKVSDSIKYSTSTSKKDTPLKHRIQIKRKT
jgi:hypothetical protein